MTQTAKQKLIRCSEEYVEKLEDDNRAMAEALKNLLEYVGGGDTTGNHPCAKARAALAKAGIK